MFKNPAAYDLLEQKYGVDPTIENWLRGSINPEIVESPQKAFARLKKQFIEFPFLLAQRAEARSKAKG